MLTNPLHYQTGSAIVRRTIAWGASAVAAALVLISPSSCLAADFVIHISVDGLNSSHLQTQIGAGLAPNFKRFQDEGAWTNNARTDFTHTITLPNHTSMLTGRPVSLPAGMSATTHHGYTQNDIPPATETLHNFTIPNWYKASTFDVVHDAGLSTALYASKTKFVIYDQSYNGAPGSTHPEEEDEIDSFANPENSMVMQSQLLADLALNEYEYTFVHYADADDSGHSSGWGSAAYLQAITRVDTYLGQLFDLVEDEVNNPSMVGRTAIVLSADHGGAGFGHGSPTNAANYTIPFYVWGAGVAHGDLYSLNEETRTNPLAAQLSYTAAGQPIRNGDGGNLALSLLGLGPIPGSMINLGQDLHVALPGDFNLDNVVNAADYAAWRKGVGTASTPGQYNLWRTNYGTSLGGGAGGAPAPVPEPALATLVIAAAFVAMPRLHRWIRSSDRTAPSQRPTIDGLYHHGGRLQPPQARSVRSPPSEPRDPRAL